MVESVGWRRGAVAAAVATYCWWATGLRPFSWLALLAVVGPGVAAGAWGSRLPPILRSVSLSPVHTAVLALLLAAVAGWELAAYLQQPRSDHPTLSVLVNRALDPHPVRALALLLWLVCAATLARARWRSARWPLLAGWLWLGWHLFVRASR